MEESLAGTKILLSSLQKYLKEVKKVSECMKLVIIVHTFLLPVKWFKNQLQNKLLIK